MSVVTDDNAIKELLTRGVVQVYPSYDEVFARFKEGKPLRIYLGIDPTGAELHLGHSGQLLFLKRLYDMGHKPILLRGDFTARIGDPTDKESERQQLTPEQVNENMKEYQRQAGKILPVDEIEHRFQSEWYENMSAYELLKVTSQETIQHLMERDMFEKRMKAGKDIHAHEVFYPLLQGYDSVAMDVDGEVGGNDQTFNMLEGRRLMKKLLSKDKIVFARKLLEDPATGKKLMSKTAGDYIPLDASATDMFGGIMALSDASIIPLFESITDVPMERIQELEQELKDGANPRDIKAKLGHAIVRMYHGRETADKVKSDFQKVFSDKGTPDDMPELSVGKDGMTVLDILVEAKMAPSKSEARRLIDQGAVSVNDMKIEKWETNLKADTILKIGAHRFLKLV